MEGNIPLRIKNYNIYRKDRTVHGGGLCIAVHKSIPSHEISINTNLEILACKVIFHNISVVIYNVYFNEQANVTEIELNVLTRIKEPKIIAGDVNANNRAWGSDDNNSRGILINDWALDNSMFILNDGSPTRYDVANNKYSHLDLSIVDINYCDKYSWKTIADRLISDHFPILVEYGFKELYKTKLPRWIIQKANWKKFRESISLPIDFAHTVDPCNEITQRIILGAQGSIPKSKSVVNNKYSNCWWNEECKTATLNAKKQFTKLQRNSTPENARLYTELEEVAKTTLLEAKKGSWDNYVSTITRTTSVKEMWTKVQAISGKMAVLNRIVLIINNNSIGEPSLIAEKFGEFFSFINSTNNYPNDFLAIKNREEAREIMFYNVNTWYNRKFRFEELETALDTCTGSSPGLDSLHYSMFKELSYDQKLIILDFINYLWLNDLFPDVWRTAIVIPILKPGKVSTECTSYRPISLTSCFCKLMEKMVNRRLIRFLDQNNIIQPYQSGSRKFHSTYDSLVRFESAIRETLLDSDYLVAVYFDIEKAFDMVWVHGLLKILKDIGLDGHLPYFIKKN